MLGLLSGGGTGICGISATLAILVHAAANRRKRALHAAHRHRHRRFLHAGHGAVSAHRHAPWPRPARGGPGFLVARSTMCRRWSARATSSRHRWRMPPRWPRCSAWPC
ncbi:hypothetical protein ACU4GD_28820 [Cupriavidus basilensis]